MNLKFHPPSIAAYSGYGPRPFWSVMIPVYNPPEKYLEETLRSVLAQDPGPEQMQIELVDDCSPKGAPVELVRQISGGRVTVYRGEKNLGLAGIWNRCIERARGEWIHILHQDDLVRPGFYAALRRGVETDPRIGAAFVRHTYINDSGAVLHETETHLPAPGIITGWHEKITMQQFVQCAAIVVRRAAYEKIGGYLSSLCYTLDWEMWQRLAANFPVWFEPELLACYRQHSSSTTSRLRLTAADTRDIRTMIELTQSYHPPDRGARLARAARAFYARMAVENSRSLVTSGHARAAGRQVAEALRLSAGWPVWRETFSLGALWLRCRASGLKHRLHSAHD